MADLPAVLRMEEVDTGRFAANHPDKDPEGRDVVFSGQLLAQMIMASDAVLGSEKEATSVHAIFARAGRYSAGPLELVVDTMHSGRAWASTTVTVNQGDRLLTRGLVLANAPARDLVRHAPPMPDVPGPEESPPANAGVVFPDADARLVDLPDAVGPDGSPVSYVWFRAGASFGSVAADQAVVAWSQPGLIIGAALRPHSDVVTVRDAHQTISTGVISHTAHFHDEPDLGEWLLFAHEGSAAGRGRIFGTGAVFTRDGRLVSTFSQDSMARRIEGAIDPKSGL
jgi:acyl-CoA thioesterase II